MHAIEIAEWSHVFTSLVPRVLANRNVSDFDTIKSYWMAARLRHDRWIEQLARFREQGTEHKSKVAFLKSQLTGWRSVIPVLQEVLLAEPLAHCVAAFATKLDDRGIDTELVGVANRVLELHQEARKRCLHLMVFGQGLPVETAVELNRVRRNIDNYTESLKGIISRGCDTIHFRQFDVTRFLTTTQFWQLRKSTAHNIDWRCCSPHWNSEILRSTLGLINGEAFDSFGTLKSPSSTWNATASDTTGHNNDLSLPLVEPLKTLQQSPSRADAAFANLRQSSRRW